MKKLFGKNVDVFLKQDSEIISGLLFDSDDECVYLQIDTANYSAIPKENIKYYTVCSTETSSKPKAEPSIIDRLDIFVDREIITSIPVPPTFNLSIFNDDIMKVALSNKDVQIAIGNRIQKSVEYIPGKMYITTAPNDILTTPSINRDSFSMSGPNPINSYLTPSEMAARLNKTTKKKPEEEKSDE